MNTRWIFQSRISNTSHQRPAPDSGAPALHGVGGQRGISHRGALERARLETLQHLFREEAAAATVHVRVAVALLVREMEFEGRDEQQIDVHGRTSDPVCRHRGGSNYGVGNFPGAERGRNIGKQVHSPLITFDGRRPI